MKTLRLSMANAVVFFFCSCIAYQLFEILFLISSHRIPLHDSFCRLTMQYYIFNHAAVYGEPPHWIPYLTHGTTCAPWYGIYNVSDIVLYACLLSAQLFKDVNFLIIAYGSVVFDKLVLLTGSLLLGRQLWRSWSAGFFIGMALLSSPWSSQPYFNFANVYGLPLTLYLIHRFIDTGRWKYGFLAANFFAVQTFGNIAYLGFFQFLILCVYLFFYSVLNFAQVREFATRLRFNKEFVIAFAGILLTLTLLILLWTSGMSADIVRTISTRNADGSVPLPMFLQQVTWANINRTLEAVLGVSISRDYTLYSGLLTVIVFPLALTAGRQRQALPFLLTGLCVVMIGSLKSVATGAYYAIPFMKFFKHLFLLGPLAKVFLIIYAATGWQRLVTSLKDRTQGSFVSLMTAIVLAVTLFAVGVQPDWTIEILKWMGFHMAAPPQEITNMCATLRLHGWLALGFALTIFFFKTRPRWSITVMAFVLLLLHAFDVFSYSWGELHKRTVKVDERVWETFVIKPLVYDNRRQDASRQGAISWLPPQHLSRSVHYWTDDAWIGIDHIQSPFRTEYLLAPLQQLITSLYERSSQPIISRGHLDSILNVPDENPVFRKMAGMDADKIQFFTTALQATPKVIQKILADPDFAGDRLLISQSGNQALTEPISGDALNRNDRINVEYDIIAFSGQHLKLRLKKALTQSVWLYYSDVWDADWAANIDGQKAAVLKGNIAYKAVFVPAGAQLIELRFRNPTLSVLLACAALNALAWVAGLFVLLRAYLIESVRKESYDAQAHP